MTEKFNNGALSQETPTYETQAAVLEAAAGFLDVRLPDFSGSKPEAASAKRDLLEVILQAAGRPMSIAEMKDIIADLADYVGQEFAIANVSRHLTALKDQGRAQLLERGVYAHGELDCRGYEKSMKIGDNILAVLAASEAPLTTQEIKDYCLSHARQPISHLSVNKELENLRQQGKIRRLRLGAYVPAGFDGENDERFLTNSQLVVKVLTEGGQPMAISDIRAVFKDMGRSDISAADIRNLLYGLRNQERIRHLDKGVYACLAFNPDLYQPPADIGNMILEVLDGGLKPMTAVDVVAEMSRAANRQEEREVISRRLNELAKQDRVKKLSKGVYASLNCEEAVLRPATTSATKTKPEKQERVAPKRPAKNEEQVPTAAAKKTKPKRKKKKKSAKDPAAKRPTATVKVREKIRLLAVIDDELSVESVVAELEKDGQQVSETLMSFIKSLLERRNGTKL